MNAHRFINLNIFACTHLLNVVCAVIMRAALFSCTRPLNFWFITWRQFQDQWSPVKAALLSRYWDVVSEQHSLTWAVWVAQFLIKAERVAAIHRFHRRQLRLEERWPPVALKRIWRRETTAWRGSLSSPGPQSKENKSFTSCFSVKTNWPSVDNSFKGKRETITMSHVESRVKLQLWFDSVIHLLFLFITWRRRWKVNCFISISRGSVACLLAKYLKTYWTSFNESLSNYWN